LYRSYKDYKNVSYDLVQRVFVSATTTGHLWRARSFAEPVERFDINNWRSAKRLYTRGLYSIGESTPAEEMARQIEKNQNLMARINLPMGRVEIFALTMAATPPK